MTVLAYAEYSKIPKSSPPQRFLNILLASMSRAVLGRVVEIVSSNLARGKIFTTSIGSVDSLYPASVFFLLCESASVSDSV